MLIHIPGLLAADEASTLLAHLNAADAPWTDGRVTAGHQGAAVKHNRQLIEDSALAREMGDFVAARLERHPRFISAALPDRLYPPMFNRYEAGGEFGSHVDNSVRLVPGSGSKLRTDVSGTLFLASPDSYQGGELLIEDSYGVQAVKLPAGDLVLYPSTSVHRVTPVTQGVRLACVFWVQSMVREDAQRSLLFDMDNALQQLGASGADDAARTQLLGCYHNLLRMWATV